MTTTLNSHEFFWRAGKRWARNASTAALLACAIGGAALAQINPDAPDWTESEVPAPPAVDMGKLVQFDGAISSSLTYGLDPATLRFTPSDGLARYVLVATSSTGASNVMYEAIRCATAEFKTYARYVVSEKRWYPVPNPQWQAMQGRLPSKHALYLARAGVCDGAAPTGNVNEVVRRLKTPNTRD